MILLQKWDEELHAYLPFESPARVLSLYSEDMLAEVDCANCGKRMTYGDGYTSMTIHNEIGLGYPVCEKCYQQEWEDRKKAGR